MELSVKVVTRPLPGIWARVVILVIIIVAVVVVWRAGYSLADAVTAILGAGLASIQVARALLASAMSAPRVSVAHDVG
jgi:hypothetical protein